MRYEDTSHMGGFQASGPDARGDNDAIPAGSREPATGNVITGEGTQTGPSGSDMATGAHITAIEGAGGKDASFAGGKLAVSGEHGRITIDAEGNYSYQAKANAPENSRDRFTYTLADSQGGTDTAVLTIEIGKTPAVIKSNAQQVVVGPDGVVVLPEGVQLSDILIVGRNLVVNLPDGGQMVIIDGAVFVPQLVLGGVEVPATNLAALLVGQEIAPAAGEGPPQSSGGNFEVPVAPLDPGVPLGDLIPPTEYSYQPPEVREVFDILDREPEIFVQPDGQPASVAAVDSVDEKGLPTREGEPEGSGEEAAAGANGDTSEATGGNIIYDSPDGVASITINGIVVTSVGQVIPGDHGDLVITSIAPGQIGYSYTLTDNTLGNDTQDDFSVVLTDSDGDVASATLTIDIIDDVPTARPDTDVVPAGQYGPVTGNVITDASAGDAEDSDNGRDTVGADDASLTAVTGAGATQATEGGWIVQGQYGVLTISDDGSYSYTRNEGSAGGVSDVFTYTLTDGDGDVSSTTLTITIQDSPPTIDVPVAGEDGTVVDEQGLPTRNGGEPAGSGEIADGNGADNDDTSETTSGTVNFTDGDGPATIRIDGVIVTAIGQTFAGDHGTLTITAITANSVSYSYTLTDNTSGEDTSDSFAFSVTDQDGDVAEGDLVIDIIDDVPTAANDTDLVPAGTYGPETGNVITGVGTTSGAAGADVVGADNSAVTALASNNVPANSDSDATGGYVVAGQYGILTMQSDGSYSYVRNADSPGGVSDVFTYTITDGDGDPSSATLTISIADAAPLLGTPAPAQLDDETFPGGNPGGTGDVDPNTANLSGSLAGSGGDGDLDYAFTGTNTLPAGFSVDPTSTATTLYIAQAGVGIVLTITLDLETGAYTVTQNQPMDHAAGLNENDLAFGIGVKVIDVDGDSAINTLTINVDDDTPLAFNDTDTVAAGTATGNVISGVGTTEGAANADKPGADGYDTITALSGSGGSDSDPSGGFTAPGTYGTLQMDAAGNYTYTRAAGTPGGVSESFTYTYRDGDGDLASATLTIAIPDATPTLPAPATALLDDDALSGGNAGGTGDDPDNQNTSGSLAGTGGDGDLDYAFTGTNTLPTGFSIDPTSTATTLYINQTGVGIVLTVTLNLETGAYTVTQNLPLVHPTAGATEENLTFGIGVKVIDVDGDSATSTLSINVDDDTPTMSIESPLQVDNTGDNPTATGDFAVSVGADKNADFDDLNLTNFSVLVNGQPVAPADLSITAGAEDAVSATYNFSFDYDTGSGGTTTATGTIVFYKSGPNVGTYTVTLDAALEGFTTFETADGTAFVGYALNTNPAGPDATDNTQPQVAVTTIAEESTPGAGDGFFVQFTGFSAGNGSHETVNYDPVDPATGDGVAASWAPGELISEGTGADALWSSWVSVSGSSNGVAGDTVNGPDGLNFDLYGSNPGGTVGGLPTTSATDMYLVFDGIGTSDDMVVVLKLWSDTNGNGEIDAADDFTTKAVIVEANDIYRFDSSNEAGTIAALTGTQYEGVLNDIVGLGGSNNNDGLVIIESNDYNGVGENWQIVGAQIVNTSAGVSGTGVNLNPVVGDTGDSDADNTGGLDTQSFALVDDTAPMKITNIGFVAGTTNEQNATLEFDLTVTDNDGDTVTLTDVTVNIGDTSGNTLLAPLSTSTSSTTMLAANDDYSSLLAGDTSQKWSNGNGNGNGFGNFGNTGIVTGMVAASGLAAMSTTSLHSFSDPSLSALVQDSFQQSSIQMVGRESAVDGDLFASASLSGLSGSTVQSTQLSGSTNGFNQPAEFGHGLDNHMLGEFAAAIRPAGFSDQGIDIAHAAIAATPAPVVAMASAEMLQLANLVGNVQQGGSVEKVLADALGQGAAPTVDHLLQAVGSHGNGSVPEIVQLASLEAGGVPGWDMSGHGAFASATDMMFKMDALVLHHDAVQPVVNG